MCFIRVHIYVTILSCTVYIWICGAKRGRVNMFVYLYFCICVFELLVFLYLCICASCICTSGTVAEGGRATIKELSDQSGVNCLARWSKYFALHHKIHTTQIHKYTDTKKQIQKYKNIKIFKELSDQIRANQLAR